MSNNRLSLILLLGGTVLFALLIALVYLAFQPAELVSYGQFAPCPQQSGVPRWVWGLFAITLALSVISWQVNRLWRTHQQNLRLQLAVQRQKRQERNRSYDLVPEGMTTIRRIEPRQ